MRCLLALVLFTTLPLSVQSQARFDVAGVRPATQQVEFERDGRTTITRRELQMHDVSVSTCLAYAYSVSTSQVLGPASLHERRYDITAKADYDANDLEMRQMLQTLLKERFHLTLHHEQKEMRGYVLSVFANPPRDPAKFRPSVAPGEVDRENSASGTVAHKHHDEGICRFPIRPTGRAGRR